MKKVLLGICSVVLLISCGTNQTNKTSSTEEPLLTLKYVGLFGDLDSLYEEGWKEMETYSPFINDIPQEQIIQSEIYGAESIMALCLLPKEGTTLKIEGINTKKIYYESDSGKGVLLLCTMDPKDPNTLITVSKGNDSITYKPSFSYDKPRLRNDNKRIIDETDYDAFEDTLLLPSYVISCMSIIYYIPEIHEQLESGEKSSYPLYEEEINGTYYLIFGYGDDPQNNKIEKYYAIKPFDPDVIYTSDDAKEWKPLN